MAPLRALKCLLILLTTVVIYRLTAEYDVFRKLPYRDENGPLRHSYLSESDLFPTRATEDEDVLQWLNIDSTTSHSDVALDSSTSIAAQYEERYEVKQKEQRQQTTENRLMIGSKTFSVQSEIISYLIHLSRKVAEQYGFVTLQFFNRGYINITKSWVCNVKCMGVLPRVLFIATDQDALDGLSRLLNHDVQVLLIPFETDIKLSIGKVGYYRFILLRTWIVLVLLQRNIPVALIESDAVWFDDALPFISKYRGFDIVSSSNTLFEKGISGGFIYVNTTAPATQAWLDMYRKFEGYMRTQENEFENMAFVHSEVTTLARGIHGTDVKVKTLPLKYFVSGLWYQNATLREVTQPIVIQNNYIIGVETKVSQAQAWGHWYLREDGHCKDDSELVQCS